MHITFFRWLSLALCLSRLDSWAVTIMVCITVCQVFKRGYKNDRFLVKIYWYSAELSRIGHHFWKQIGSKIIFITNVNNRFFFINFFSGKFDNPFYHSCHKNNLNNKSEHKSEHLMYVTLLLMLSPHKISTYILNHR